MNKTRHDRALRNRERWGSVEDRARRCAKILHTDGPLTPKELMERTGLSAAALGGALGRAKQMKLGIGRSGGKWRAQ